MPSEQAELDNRLDGVVLKALEREPERRYQHASDVKNDVEKDPRAWIVREKSARNKPTAYADYPNPDAKPVTLHLNEGGRNIGGLSFDGMGGYPQH